MGCFGLRSAQSARTGGGGVSGQAHRPLAVSASHPAPTGPWEPLGTSGPGGDGSAPPRGPGPDCWLLRADCFSSHVLRVGKNERKGVWGTHSQTKKSPGHQTGTLSSSEWRVQEPLGRDMLLPLHSQGHRLDAQVGNLGQEPSDRPTLGNILWQKQSAHRTCHLLPYRSQLCHVTSLGQ